MADKIFEIAGINRTFPEVSSGLFAMGVAIAGGIAGADLANELLTIRQKDGWSTAHVPAANAQATITKAAGGVGIKHVVTGFTAALVAGAAAPAAVQLTVNLIDGGTGGTNYLWRAVLSLTAVAGQSMQISRGGLWLVGSFNTAVTLEFSAAGGANTVESVSLEGISLL